jgi:hypothetical protein
MVKSRVLLLLVTLLMLIPTGSLTGCSGEGEKSNAINAIEENDPIQLMKMFPSTGGKYMYLNLVTLRKPEFSGMYRYFASDFAATAKYGVSLDDGSSVAMYDAPMGQSAVLSGHFDLNKVKKQLDEANTQSTYRGTGIWTELSGGRTFAIINGLLMVGYSEGIYKCIDVTKGLEQSLYDNKGLQDVMGRLPKTAFLLMTYDGASKSFPSDIANCVAAAVGFEEIDAKIVGCKVVAKFTDATTAGYSFSVFEKWATTSIMAGNGEGVQAVQKGQFIEVTGTYALSILMSQF